MMIVGNGRKKLYCKPAKSLPEKIRGIMFSGPSFTPLLFSFGRETGNGNAIHSFFCPPFTAVFADARKKVTEVMDVEPWWPWVTPSKPFKYLLEVPRGKNPFSKGDELSWE